MPIDSQTHNWLKTASIVTQRVDRKTGYVEFEYNNFKTNHSWNYKVIYKLDTKTWQYCPERKLTVLAEGVPYLRLEFSAPKILWGHNLDSCSVSDALFAASFVRNVFNFNFGVSIPDIYDWYCYRLDVCANFLLDDLEQVKSYIRYLQRFDYPRRIKNNYSDTGIYFASRHNTLKIYCKGLEFKKHDRQRFLDEIEQKRLQNKANQILRIEVEHKNRLRAIREKLEENRELYSTFQGYMKIYDLLDNVDLRYEMEKVIKKFLSGTETKIMKSLDVFRLLKNRLGNKSANFYYSIYTLLITQGQSETKRQIPKATYYNALKIFRELGISIIASDIKKLDIELSKGFPEDFSIEMSESNKYYQLPKAA